MELKQELEIHHPQSATIQAEDVTSVEPVDPAVEKALLRKLDKRIIPLIVLMYLMSFMDRVNIGNARLYGLEEDLGLKGDDYQLAVSILFVTYCLFEVPSNLILKKMQPARYLPGLVLTWGTIATLSGLVKNFGELIACRLLLGLFEAGLFPGLTLYLSMFYNRTHIAFRTALLLSTAAFAGAIGGLLACVIGYMDGIAGLSAWRWIFILEGIATVLLSIVVFLLLPNSPETAKILTDEDRKNLTRLRYQHVGQTAAAQHFHREDLKMALVDWKIYVMAIGHWCTNLMFYSFSIFLPTIIRQMGTWSVAEVQALTIPVYATGAFAYITVAYISDRIQQRGIFAASFFLFSLIGYALLLADLNVASKFTATFLISIGTYTVVGIPIAWVVANQPRYAKRAFASGLQLTVGNSAGIATPFLYSTKDSPRFRPGYSATIALLVLGSSIYTIMHIYYKRQNKLRATGKLDHTVEGKTQREIEEMGEMNPEFRFTI